MPRGGARGQNLGHLCYVICICIKVFQMLISRQSLITKHSYLKLGYLGGSSEIPKEHVARFMHSRGVTIHLPHDTIRIVILTSRYDTYRDTFNQTDRLTHTQPGHAISLFSC